jgi:hypothetical protein
VDVSLNSIQANRFINQKKSIDERRLATIDPLIATGNLTEKRDFIRKKNQSTDLTLSNTGKFISEKNMYATRDEQDYFTSSKIFTKPDPS